MGGFGSGRISTRCRGKVERTRFIRAEWVKERMTALETGMATKIGWTRDGKPYGEASVSLIGNRLHIKYLQRSTDEDEWQDVHEAIELSYTTPHFGGKRLWLQCPHCAHRVAVLYCSEVVACRRCLQLAYRTEGEDEIDRLRSKAAKLKERLRRNPYRRPKGMHQKTFSRLRDLYFATCFRVDELSDRRWAKLQKRFLQLSAGMSSLSD